MMKTPAKLFCNIQLFLIGFLALSAIGGGLVLIIAPNGKLMGMPLSLLEKSPFDSFLIPGIILFTVLGIAPVLLARALFKKIDSKLAEKFNFFKDMHWTWSFSIYIAFVLIFWLQIEMQMLSAVGWLHTFYMLLAVVMIFVALLPQVRNLCRKENNLS